MLATSNGHKRLRALTTTTVAAEGDMSHDHKGSSSVHVGEKLSLDSEERRGCYVFVALQKKTLAMSKGHERLRAVTATAVATEGDMGFDHRRSTSRHVGEMLSLDSEERRGKRCSGWSRSCRWTAKASMVTPDLEIRTRRSRQT
ncbi:hypothetical protein GW17_00053300 [Ensete ventricosum]|nr:hypothetical protein GW17_00053300 [Ensete ventricosum]